jgi:hypothetical protein
MLFLVSFFPFISLRFVSLHFVSFNHSLVHSLIQPFIHSFFIRSVIHSLSQPFVHWFFLSFHWHLNIHFSISSFVCARHKLNLCTWQTFLQASDSLETSPRARPGSTGNAQSVRKFEPFVLCLPVLDGLKTVYTLSGSILHDHLSPHQSSDSECFGQLQQAACESILRKRSKPDTPLRLEKNKTGDQATAQPFDIYAIPWSA